MGRKRRITILCIGIILTLVGTAVLAWPGAPRLYRTTILPTWSGQSFVPEALNDLGQVVGVMNPGRPPWHLVVWDRKNGVQDLGAAIKSDYDINNRGQIAGTAFDPNGIMQAFVMDSDGAARFLGSLGDGPSEARAINDRGQVVGRSHVATGSRGFQGTHAFIWDRTNGMRDLGATGGRNSEATAISEAGQVFGFFEYWDGPQHHWRQQPCYWDPADGVGAPAVATPGRSYRHMNGNGWVVGKHVFMKDGPHVVLWQEYGGLEKLFLYSPDEDVFEQPTLIVNDVNQVVYTEDYRSRWEQFSTRLFPRRQRSWLWDRKRGKTRLDRYLPRGTRQFVVCDLNDTGCILGVAHLKDGRSKLGVLLEPIPQK